MTEPSVEHHVIVDNTGSPVLAKRSTDPGGRARLAREHATLVDLDGLDVVEPVDLVITDDATALHLRWVGAHSLGTVAGLDPEYAGRVVAAVAATVRDLHCAGRAHGRLTADHVLLDGTGTPVLTGLADAQPIDPHLASVDVAALGELLTDTLRRAHRDIDPVDSRVHRSRNAGLRAALLTLADHAQAPDPEVRPTIDAFAAAVADTLPRARRGRRPGVDDDRPRPRRRRHPPGRRPARADPSERAQQDRGPEEGRRPRHPTFRRPSRNEPRPRRPAVRRIATRIGVGLAVGVTVGGSFAAVAAKRSAPVPAPAAAPIRTEPSAESRNPATSAPATSPPAPTTASTTSAPATSPLSPTTSAPADAAPATGPGANPCGPGASDEGICGHAVRVDGERVTFGGTTWVVGRTGDRVVVGDWDCDGMATAASLRPSSGEIFVFDRWALPGDEVTVDAAATIPGGIALEAPDPDGDRCPDLVVVRDDDRRVRVVPS